MSIIFNIVANIIKLIHAMIIIFVLYYPFVSYNFILDIVYLIFIPFMILHWKYNNDDCALTVLENYIRGNNLYEKDTNKNFMYNLLNPIFNLPKLLDQYWKIFLNSDYIYIIVCILYIIKLYNVYHYLNNKYDISYNK